MPEIAAKLVNTVVDKTVRKGGSSIGREVAEKAVKEAFGKDVKEVGAKAVAKAVEKPVVELPKVALKNPLSLLVSAEHNIEGPRLSPDGKWLTYIDGEEKDVPKWIKKILGMPESEKAEKFTAWVAPVDGTEPPRKIAGKTFHNVVQPTFRPDGKAVLMAEQKNLPFLARGEKLHEMKLTEVDLASGAKRTVYNGDITLIHPQYHPDGKSIAAYSRQPGKEGLYLLDATKPGAEPVRLTNVADKHPIWSEDGKKLFFHNQTNAEEEGAEKAWLGVLDMTDPKNPKRTMIDDVASDAYHKHPTPLPNSDLVVYHVADQQTDKKWLEVVNTVTKDRAKLPVEGVSPNGSKLSEFKHAAFGPGGDQMVVLGKAKKKNALDRGIPEHWRVYTLQNATQIVQSFKDVFGR
jgi:hypothetical protein